MQRFVDDFGPFEEEFDDGATPWALGDDDGDGDDVFESWESDDDLSDDWLDRQLAGLGADVPPEADDAAGAGVPVPAGPGGGPDAGPEAGPEAGMVLRRPAPTRHRRRRADRIAAADLPEPNVPGYLRDRRGTWRYTANGRTVPGARDLTLRGLYRFPVHHGQVQVPVDLVRSEAELAWCLRWKDTLTTRLSGRRSLAVLRIPVGEWERRADVPFGLYAPELSAPRLLGIADVARLAGVSPGTITAYLSRRRMPEPVVRLGHAPLWSRPVIRQWLAARPGQGRRALAKRRSG